MTKLYFITGACGTGKSSIIPYLKKNLKGFNIHDFDEVGVPENPTMQWRKNTTDYWLKVASENAKKDISTLIVGLSIPQEVMTAPHFSSAPKIYYCLLDISEEERCRRLSKRGASKELIEDLEELVGLRKWVPKSKFEYVIIDTTTLSAEETGKKVISWIKKIEELA